MAVMAVDAGAPAAVKERWHRGCNWLLRVDRTANKLTDAITAVALAACP